MLQGGDFTLGDGRGALLQRLRFGGGLLPRRGSVVGALVASHFLRLGPYRVRGLFAVGCAREALGCCIKPRFTGL